ncbi:hypothetical protein JXB31_04150 [Candidatus Woesearchaeota archaeon]|nr:hypothetical protein [Candidatus Woesearchaeota archaeon]
MILSIIASKKDIAGMNIKEVLQDEFGFIDSGAIFHGSAVLKKGRTCLYTVETDSVDCNRIDREIDSDIIVFASRHQGSDCRPIFSCHTPGNWAEAGMGGISSELCICPAALLKETFLILKQEHERSGLAGFEVTLECTHHGPYLEKPCIYIEIGSKEEQWKDKNAARVICRTLSRLSSEQEAVANPKARAVFGIGGPHYCNSFNRIQDNTELSVGHICPKYMLSHLDKQMIGKAIERTMPKPDLILLDWKGLGSEKQRIQSVLDELGIAYKKTKEIKYDP